MTFIKISQLPETNIITDDDYLVMVDDPSGTPVTKKISSENFVFSAIVEVDGGDISA